MSRRHFLQRSTHAIASLGLSVGLTLTLLPAQASDFPNRPITLIVPYSAGGPTDTHVRAVANAASQTLGVPIIIENKPGANGTNAARTLPRAEPDGHTLGILPAGVYREPHMMAQPFDPRTDFTYIAQLSDYTFGLAVPANAPWQTWDELVSAARAQPGRINIGTPGVLSTSSIVMDEMAETAGLQLNLIPYRGDAEIAAALLGGHVDAAPLSGIAVPHIDAGRLRYLVALTPERVARYPELPTLHEAGLPYHVDSPYGVAGPAGMDPARIALLSAAFAQALQSPDSERALSMLNQNANYLDPEAYRAYAMAAFEREAGRIARLRERGTLN